MKKHFPFVFVVCLTIGLGIGLYWDISRNAQAVTCQDTGGPTTKTTNQAYCKTPAGNADFIPDYHANLDGLDADIDALVSVTTDGITGTGPLTFAAGGTNQNVTLTPSGTGSVVLSGPTGVNDSTPTSQLDITPDSNSRIGFIIAHPSASTVDSFRMTDGGTTKVVIDNNGQVSMGGITTPQQNLTVGGADGAFALGVMTGTGVPSGESIYQQFQGRPYIGYSQSAGSRNLTGTPELTLAYETGSVAIGNSTNVEIELLHTAKNIDFYTDATHAVQIDEFQQLGVGTSNPAARIHAKMTGDEAIWFENDATAASALSGAMYGLQLSAATMNATAKYTPALKFMSTDPQFTTENPKWLAGILGEATEAYAADTAGGMRLNFLTTGNAPGASNVPSIRWYIDQDGGLVASGATGGSKGAGSINITGDIEKNDTAYANPDYVFEHWQTGKIERFANSEGAAEYPGVRPLQEVKNYVQEHYHFPHISREPMGAFGRGDKMLELMEESFIHHFEHDERLTALEKTIEVQALYISELHERLTALEAEKGE